jgi:hypothetical protein
VWATEVVQIPHVERRYLAAFDTHNLWKKNRRLFSS